MSLQTGERVDISQPMDAAHVSAAVMFEVEDPPQFKTVARFSTCDLLTTRVDSIRHDGPQEGIEVVGKDSKVLRAKAINVRPQYQRPGKSLVGGADEIEYAAPAGVHEVSVVVHTLHPLSVPIGKSVPSTKLFGNLLFV